MRRYYSFVFVILLLACTVGKTDQTTEANNTMSRDTTSGQKTVGLITDSILMPVIGIAENQKGGAVVLTDERTYWIENLTSWDDQYLKRPVRVWGQVVVRSDNPVFLDTGVVINQGIPVESEQELRSQQQRTWIINAHYELVRP